MNYGTITHSSECSEKYFVIDADFEVELAIQRLIPSSLKHPLRVRVQPENTRLLRMVIGEFPLEIKTNMWESAINEISKLSELATNVSKLEYVEPHRGFFHGKLLPFQKQGLDFLQKTDGNTLVTDEMGLGKTIETLAYISTRTEHLPVVVVAPVVTLINWKREIEKFLSLQDHPKFKQQTLSNNIRKPIIEMIRHGIKKGKNNDLKPADFYLINYELVDKRLRNITEVNPKIIVYDEIQSLRNTDTNKYVACNALSSHSSVLHRIGLSGTPIYNKGIEMYNICEIIKKGILGDRSEFIRRYCQQWNSSKTDDNNKQALSKVLQKTIMIRRKKIDVLDDLPDKIRMKQPLQIDTSLYESEIQKLYEKINTAKTELGTLYTKESQKQGLFELNKRIREMRVAERQIAGLAKAPFVINYLNKLLEEYEDEKFVIFCHHRSVHEALFDGLFMYNPLQIIGGQSDIQRQDAIDSFQNDKESRVIICGLRAGNVGITLTRSAYVIFAELDWSPSIHRQAEDRLHRIGQKSRVFAHYLEGVGTFDEKLSPVLLRKTVEITNVLGDKMESLNNQKALEFLDQKFHSLKSSTIGEVKNE